MKSHEHLRDYRIRLAVATEVGQAHRHPVQRRGDHGRQHARHTIGCQRIAGFATDLKRERRIGKVRADVAVDLQVKRPQRRRCRGGLS